MSRMYIVVDFDGTCVEHRYPHIGETVEGCVEVLRELVRNRHSLILFTMRDGKELDDAVRWFSDNDITLFGIQTNPFQSQWTSSPKAYGHIHIDDAALGCPLIQVLNGRPYVDWIEIDKMLVKRELYKENIL